MANISISRRVLRLIGAERFSNARDFADVLRAIPHIDYLRNFARVEWDPMLMGLEPIGMGFESTLVAAPKAALEWLGKIECLREGILDIPLVSRAPFDVWREMAEAPRSLRIAADFTSEGGFVNYWTDEDKTHILWGRVNLESAQSVLAFVWLQNVLAGGRRWQRRELGLLPRDFREWLPLAYICLEPKSVRSVSLGLPRPILRTRSNVLGNALEWIEAGIESDTISRAELYSAFVPQLKPSQEDCVVSLDSVGRAPALLLEGENAQLPLMLGFYSSMMGSQIDRHQEGWDQWISQAIPEMSSQRRLEILLCLREALINADRHGCGGRPGKRILLALKKDASHRLLKAQISDPGCGHKYDIHAPTAVQDQLRGKHLGLMLIHGLADRVRFGAGGATIEFDFGY